MVQTPHEERMAAGSHGNLAFFGVFNCRMYCVDDILCTCNVHDRAWKMRRSFHVEDIVKTGAVIGVLTVCGFANSSHG